MSRKSNLFDEESQHASPTSKTPIHSVPSTISPNDSEREIFNRMTQAAAEDLLNRDDDNNTVLNIATLQRMVLFQLQLKIIEKTSPIIQRRFGSSNPLDDIALRKALTDYAQAVRDWDLMVEYGRKADGDLTRDPFCITSKWELVSEAMNNAGLLEKGGIYHFGSLDRKIGLFKQRNQMNRDRSWREFTLRFSIAIFGGLALIGPMLLMVLHNDLVTALTTTSVAVFLISVVISIYSTAAPEGVVATIAAYAAVLVVFVGTIQPNSSAAS
ncbi:hypothetical protein F5B18DRAFT_238904 [Nemania serpens]|nr:hypothetical protein F5B18DRAFT_238904 [Nemania serpens]